MKPSHPAQQKPSPVLQDSKSPAPTVIPLALVMVIAALGTSLINVLLPTIADQFTVSIAAVQWATLAFLLSSTVLILPVGRLADTFGRRRVLRVGLSVFTAASLLIAVSPNLEVLIAARAIQGAGVAAMLSLPLALVRQTVTKDQVGRAMGLIGTSMATGMALGPALGGLLSASVLGWRGTVFVFVPLGVMSWLLLGRIPVVSIGTPQRTSVDIKGLCLLILALSGYGVALTFSPGGLLGTAGLLLLVAVVIVLWVLVEKRTEAPLVDFGKLRRYGILPGLFMNFCGSFIMMTFTTIPPFYLIRALGLNLGWMGLAMAVGPVAAILSGLPAGRLVDRWGAARMTAVGLSTMTIAALGFVVLVPLWGVAGFLIAAILLTPGNQMFMAGNNTAIMSRAGSENQGEVSGMLTLARNLGFITSTAVMALIFNSFINVTSGTSGATQGLRACFGLAGLVGVIAVLIAWRQGAKNDAVR